MKTVSTTKDLHFRNRMLTQAAGFLAKAGRAGSAKIVRRHRHPDLTNVKAQTEIGVRARFLPPTPGYQIADRLPSDPAAFFWQHDIIGIVGDATSDLLQHRLVQADLTFDGYDRALSEHAVHYLVIETDALARKFGWQNALTLRDPAATVELVTMIQKARAAGIVTILIRPAQVHRFPLLSRIVDIFDHVMDRPNGILELHAV